MALILAVGVVSGCATTAGTRGESTLPDGVSAADVALFKSTVTQAGCQIDTRAAADDIANQTGFDRDKLRIITQYLTLAGESAPTATGFRLTSGSCANA